MQEFETKTGFGYLKDAQGNITDKCVFRPGRHKLSDGYTFVEVATEEELAGIEVYIPPVVESPAQRRKRLIREEIELMAVERLQAKGKL